MPIRRHSLLIPCRRLDDLPTHLAGDSAAELLAAWTALWHPSLIHATAALPGWHPADEPPDPAELDGELILIPSVSRQRLAADWCDRLRATGPRNPPPVDAMASRRETIAAALSAASIESNEVSTESASDFLALGHAHLQVELLTRAMRYTSVLDTDQFTRATLAAANAAVADKNDLAQEEIARAFDLLADARNHVYAVDYYVVDVTLLASSTLGDSLREKLVTGSATSLLASGELLDEMARAHPATLAELRRAIEAGTACVVGGMYHGETSTFASPEAILAELSLGQEAFRRHLGRDCEVFGQFRATFSPLLPEILAGMGFRGALHATFDGGRLPRADQCKTWWGPRGGASIEALAANPLDAARPETWLKLAERIGDTIAHDHVATILLAGWPGTPSEYDEDLLRAARYGPVLGKLVTLEEYFRVSRQPDDWTSFDPREYPSFFGTDEASNLLSKQVDTYRGDVNETHRRLAAGLAAAVAATAPEGAKPESSTSAMLNPWSFSCPRFVGVDPLDFLCATDSASVQCDDALAEPVAPGSSGPLSLSDVPGCGFATLDVKSVATNIALADGRILRNERLELTVSDATGGIQSLRTHRDRSTRLSQRLVFQHGSSSTSGETQMVAERIEITRNDDLIGEITSRGKLLDAEGDVLAQFAQSMRVARGLPAILVNVWLEPQRLPDGDAWSSYYASRLAWRDEESSLRRGLQWTSHETSRQCIESPEWVEINDCLGTITCFGLGLGLHRRVDPSRLDTLMVVTGGQDLWFQFALALDESYPAHTALSLLTAGRPCEIALPGGPNSSRGWFLHVGAKNVVITHIEPLPAPTGGIRLRLLETEGRDSHTTLAAFRPFRAARTTDFRGNSTGVLSVVEGGVQFDIGAHRLLQIEAEW